MPILPVAQTMTLCDYVIVEERTKKVSYIGIFWGMGMGDPFPVRPLPFSVVVPLIGGLGVIPVTLQIGLEDGFEVIPVYEHTGPLRFADRFHPVYYTMRLQQLVWPQAGHYQFTLHSDGTELAHTSLRVYATGSQP